MANSLDFEPAQYIQIDLFPASVHPEGESEQPIGEELRVIVTDNYFYVLTEGVEGALFAIKEPLQEFDGSNKVGYTVTVSSGATYFFKRALNCGCGSRLRGIRVLPGVGQVARNLRK